MLLPSYNRYVEDVQDAKRNRLTFVGYGSGPVFTAVIDYSFSDEDTRECVNLDEIKKYCFIDGNDYDSLITTLLPMVRAKLENWLNKSLIKRTVTAKVKPGTKLPFGPVIQIGSITDAQENTYSDYDSVTSDVTVVYTAGYDENKTPQHYRLQLLKLLKAELPTL